MAGSAAEIDPTIFYTQAREGLEELVDVFIHSSGSTAAGDSADLEMAGDYYRCAFGEPQDFGKKKLEFPVPEFPARTQSKLAWTVDGRSHVEEGSIDPGKKWTIFLVPHIHLDVGFSDYQSKVAAIQSRVIDEAMDLAALRPGFSFSHDGEWSLEQ